LAEVDTCETRFSKKDRSAYFNVKLVAVQHQRKFLCFDTIMLEGPGEGIGVAKLKALGLGPADEIDGEIPEHRIIGRHAIVIVKRTVYDGAEKREIDIRAKNTKCGYRPVPTLPPPVAPPASTAAVPASSPPVDAAAQQNVGLEDDAPF
jgi:hypothetical protein